MFCKIVFWTECVAPEFRFVRNRLESTEPSGARSKIRFGDPLEPFKAVKSDPASGAHPWDTEKTKWVQWMRRERCRPQIAFQIVASPSNMRTVTTSACILLGNMDRCAVYFCGEPSSSVPF